MNIPAPRSAFETDKQTYFGDPDMKVSDMLVYAAKKSGRSTLSIGKEFGALNRSFRKINVAEYLRWALYDDTRFDDAARAQFISNDVHWPIVHKVNDPRWQAAAEDKITAATILAAGDVAVPETIAVIDPSARLYPGIEKVTTPDALRAVIAAHGTADLFGKMRDGMVSFGAFRVRAADATHITCDGHPPMTYESFMADFLGQYAYLLQKRLDNHAALHAHGTGLATVRMVNLVRAEDVYTPFAIISLPQGDNIADTLWRSGNIACDIDIATGKIRTVVRRNGHDIDFLPDHPATPGLMGSVLPHWDALRTMNDRAARLFGAIGYQSTDIAITQDGPVIVELNYGSGFGLPQNASGRGLLNPTVRGYFESRGVVFGASSADTGAARKSSGFGLFGKRG